MPKAIKDVIPAALHRTRAAQRARAQLQRRWADAVGRTLARRTRAVRLRGGRLYVQTADSGASFALNLEKPRLLKQLAAATGEPVEDIVVRIGEGA